MNQTHVGRGSSQISLRLPSDMREKIKELAKQNRRSVNSELLSIVEGAIKTNACEPNAAH